MRQSRDNSMQRFQHFGCMAFCAMALAIPLAVTAQEEQTSVGAADPGPGPVTEDPGAPTEAAKILTSVALDNGNNVEFLELLDGSVVIAERGRYPQNPTLGKTVADADDILDVYRKLTPPGNEIPRDLARTAERVSMLRRAAAADPGEGNATATAAGIRPPARSAMNEFSAGVTAIAAIDTSLCPWSWFDQQFSLVTQGPADPANWSWATRTGTTWYLNGRMSIVLASACSYRGNVRFNFWSKPTDQAIWTNDPTFTRVVHAGGWYWIMSRAEWWWQNARDIYSEVVHASGDGYHHKGVGCDRRAFSQCAVNLVGVGGWWGE